MVYTERVKMKKFVILILLVFSAVCYSEEFTEYQKEMINSTMRSIGRDYGICVAEVYNVELTIKQLMKDFPKYETQLQGAYALFYRNWGPAFTVITNDCNKIAKIDLINQFKPEFEKRFRTAYENEKHTDEVILNVISNLVNSDKELFFSEKTIRMLLEAKYRSNPAQEIRDGYYDVYRLSDYDKKQKVDYSFRFPLSMSLGQSDRKSIAVKLKQTNNFFSIIFIATVPQDVVAEIQEEQYLTRDEIADLRTKESAELMIDEMSTKQAANEFIVDMYKELGANAKVLNVSRIVKNGWPGVVIDYKVYSIKPISLDMPLEPQRGRYYVFCYKGHLLMFSSLVLEQAESETIKEAEKRRSNSFALIQEMINTIVFR